MNIKTLFIFANMVYNDTQTDHHSTAILLAAELGHLESVNVLIENGADLAMLDNDGDSVLHVAALM